MYSDRVFLFVLVRYNKILGYLVARGGFFVCVFYCCWLFFAKYNGTSPVLARRLSVAATDAMPW